jgi:hypothetical protein
MTIDPSTQLVVLMAPLNTAPARIEDVVFRGRDGEFVEPRDPWRIVATLSRVEFGQGALSHSNRRGDESLMTIYGVGETTLVPSELRGLISRHPTVVIERDAYTLYDGALVGWSISDEGARFVFGLSPDGWVNLR